ncbi:hypothetical protein HY479_03485 [Candidatus Uhrbacteria bacterium]|nr:hypothetical protein [Candidatus Uhrbacteria bacterium]
MPPNAPVGRGFTEGELKFASFWVRNKQALERLALGSLIVVNVAFWGYAAWGMLDAFAISYPRESRLTQEIASNQLTIDALERDRPQTVRTSGAQVFETTENRYDLAVDVENPNEQWWAEFNYRFNLSGQQTPLRNGFIMPASSITLTELGFRPKERGGTSAQLVVENIRWHRVDPSQVGGRYADYALNRLNMSFENLTYKTGVQVGTRSVGRTSFDVVNRGSYGFWALDLVIKLHRGSGVVAVNKLTLTSLVPGETRHVDVDWFEKLPSITQTEIIPIVNLLDPNSYLPTQYFRK